MRNGKIWQILTEFRPVYSADTMLCVDWLVSLINCFFLDLVGSEKLSYFFLNWTACVFLTESPKSNYPILSLNWTVLRN